MSESAPPYRHPAFGAPPRRRLPGDPPLPKVRKGATGKPRATPALKVRRLVSKGAALEGEVREVLTVLARAPALAEDLPKYPGVLPVIELRGLAFARCVERHAHGEPSRWLWSITPAGRQWLSEKSTV